jgi:methylphosphotriester-DNA--protein-cysteine methyltransferase
VYVCRTTAPTAARWWSRRPAASRYTRGVEYREHAPHPALARDVKCYWTLHDARPTAARPLERVVPDGRMEIVFHLAEPFRRLVPDGTPHAQRPAVLAGQLASALLLQPGSTVDLFAVRFQPWGAARLLGTSAGALAGLLPALDEVVGGEARAVEDTLRGAAHAAARAAAMDTWLLARLGRARRACSDVEATVRLALRRPTPARVHDLAAAVGRGPRRLERLFREHVGLAPKVLLRVARLQGVLRAVRAGRVRSWALAAADGGYADQAHLTREFLALAGCTPTQYAREQHPLNDGIVAGGETA